MKVRLAQRGTSSGRFTSGEGIVRVFEGPGRVLLNPAPYWRYRIMADRSGGGQQPAILS